MNVRHMLLLLALAVTPAPALAGPTIEWIRQFGTEFRPAGVAVDDRGNVYVSGVDGPYVSGGHETWRFPAGFSATFLNKYDSAGDLLWARQQEFPSDRDAAVKYSGNVTVDDLGNIYISQGPRKYDPEGNLLWTADQTSNSVAVDAKGNVLVAGSVESTERGDRDALISSLDAEGDLHWTRRLGTDLWDESHSVAVDGQGNIFTTGLIESHFDFGWSLEAFLAKYDAHSGLMWVEQLDGDASEVAVDGQGNSYISGSTISDLGGPFAGAMGDAFVAKYDPDGTLLWTQQPGTEMWDSSNGIAVNDLGNVYITGFTSGDLGGTNAGSQDTFVSKIDTDGHLIWTEQIGSGGEDFPYGIATDGLENVYITGSTTGSLGGLNAGSAFLIKLVDPVPEPASGFLGVIAIATLAMTARQRREVPAT